MTTGSLLVLVILCIGNIGGVRLSGCNPVIAECLNPPGMPGRFTTMVLGLAWPKKKANPHPSLRVSMTSCWLVKFPFDAQSMFLSKVLGM